MSSHRGDRVTWVIGAGGLLGGALTAELHRAGDRVYRVKIPWGKVDESLVALTEGLQALTTQCRESGTTWRVAWCAGAGVTASAPSDLDDEVRVFTSFLGRIGAVPDVSPRSLFLASSAGGLYAGSQGAPFTEHHEPRPISAYGDAKLAMELTAQQFGAQSGVPVLVGRIANLYGPGQNLGKPQGLISHICRAHLMGQPISIYVPLDTMRDYLFVDDCAEMIVEALDGPAEHLESPVVKIFASQQGSTVSTLLSECRRIFKRSPRVVLGSSASAQFQARDLRLASRVWPEIDRRSLTPLPVGVHATVRGLLRSVQRPG